MTDEKSILDRMPLAVRVVLLLSYFLAFTLVSTDVSPSQTMDSAAPSESHGSSDQTASVEAPTTVSAHQVPWLRLIIPDLMVSEWFESDRQRLGILDRLPILFTSLLVLVSVLILGRTLLRCLRIVPDTRLDLWVFSFSVGMSFTSLYILLIGLAGGLQVVWLYLLPVGCSLIYEMRCFLGNSGLTSLRWQGVPAIISCREAWLLMIPGGLILAGAMLPPWEFDVREYHMQVPREWYQNGQIEYLPHNIYSNMPLASELIMIPPMALHGGDDAWWHGALTGKTVMAFYALFVALGVMSIANRLGRNRSGWAAAILVLSCPWIGYISMTGLNEVALGCFMTTSILAILCSQKSEVWRHWVLLAGLLAGGAAATKYTGVVFAVIPLLVWAIWIHREKWLRSAFIFTLGAAVIFAPWLAKNTIFTGNPTYPLLNTVFDSPDRSPELLERWNRGHQVPESDQIQQHARSILLTSSRQSPLLMGLLALSLILLLTDRRLRPFAGFLIFGLLTWWFATHHLERFLVPLIPVVAILAGITLDRILPERKLFWSVCVLLTIYGFFYLGAGLENDSRILVRMELLRDGPALTETTTERVHRYLNRILKAEDRVLLVGDAEPFDLKMKTTYATCFDPDALANLLRGKSPGQQRRELMEAGIDYIYVSWEEIQRYRSTYGYDEYVTRNLFSQELVPGGVCEPDTTLDLDPEYGQLFRCVREPL